MYNTEVFIGEDILPEPLAKIEVYELLEKIKQGDKKAREKLIEHNIRLVIYEVKKRFRTVNYDKGELVAIGNVGLIKAVDTFDISMKIEFSTYAIRCIDNEILMFLKKLKKFQNDNSLERTFINDKSGNVFSFYDVISSENDLVEEYIDNETYKIILEIINDLPEFEKNIIMIRFGFNNSKIYKQNEIGDIIGVTQSSVSKLTKRVVKKVAKQLYERGIIEVRGTILDSEKRVRRKN